MSLSLLPTNAVLINQVAVTVYGVAPGATLQANFEAHAKDNGIDATLNLLLNSAGLGSDANFNAIVLANLGLASDAVSVAYMESSVAANGRLATMKAAFDFLGSVAGQDNAYGTAGTAFNSKVTKSIEYSSVATNTAASSDAVSAAAVAVGTTFTLSTSSETLTGTGSNDVFNSVIAATQGATGSTLNAGDSITGGNGTDTLNIAQSGDAGGANSIEAVRTTGIEKVLVSNFETDAAGGGTNTVTTVTASLMDGVTTMGLSSSSAEGDTKFNDVRNLVDAEMRTGAGDLEIAYNSTVTSGTSDVQNLTVSGLTGGTFKAQGVETLNITTETTKSTLAGITADKLKALNVSGDQNLTVTAAIASAATANGSTVDLTIDASKLTGELSAKIDTAADYTVSVTGGSGDDTIDFQDTLTKNDVVDLGDGIDTIKLDIAALTTQFNQVSNVETVSFNANDSSAAANTFDLSKLSTGVSTVILDINDNNNDANDDTVSNYVDQLIVIKNSADDAGATDTEVAITGATDTDADTVSVKVEDIILDSNKNDLDALKVGNFETINLESARGSSSASTTENQIDLVTATLAKSVNVTGNTNLKLVDVAGGAMTSFNASALTGDLNVTFSATDKVSVVGSATGQNTIAFGSTLNNDDSVTAGSSTKDKVTASASGLTATTGALTMSGVETLELTTGGNNTLGLAGVTGLGTLQVSANTQTITGLDLATTVIATDAATLKVTAADATGTTDVLKVSSVVSNADKDVTVEAADIETLQVVVKDTHASDNTADVRGFDLDKFEGSTITFAQDAESNTAAAVTVDLAGTTLHKNATAIDASGLKGAFTATAANATGAVTFTVQGAGIQTLTGGGKGDTFNIGSTTSIVHVINGGAGTDTVNITAAATAAFDPLQMDVEALNITLNAGESVTHAANKDFHATVDTVTISGGNSQSVYTMSADNIVDSVKSVDASNFGGKTIFEVIKNVLDDTLVLTGGASSKDELNYTIDATGTDKLYSTGLEILDLNVDETATIDLSNATGVTTVDVDLGVDAAAKTFTVDKVTTEKVVLTAADDNTADHTLEVKLADATGTSDTLTLETGGGTIDAGVKIKIADVESVTIDAENAATLDLSLLTMTTADEVMSLIVTGDTALTASATGADITTINASGMSTGGSFVQSARSATADVTYTGSDGNDTFIMSKAGDVIAGGAGTGDTLDINFAAILGGINVDLTSTTDQVVSFNGSATTGTVTGFESVDLSGYTGSFGAQVTAIKGGSVITGTTNNDQITLGAGADDVIIKTSNGNDTLISWTTASDQLHLDKSDYTLAGSAGAVAGAAYYEGAIGSATAGTDYDVFVLTGASYTDVGTAEAAVAGQMSATNNAFVVFHDTGTNNAVVYYDTNVGTDGSNGVVVATIGGVSGNHASNAGEIGVNFGVADFFIIA